jgi:Spy/CpxP family protein refolding chaperone
MDNSRTQIEAVFTPEQKAKLEAARQARQAQRQQGQRPQAGRRGNVADLNLTQDQKNRIKSIRQSSKQQIEAVLTPEQRAKLQELKANRRQRWQQRQNNQTPPQS